MLSFFFSTCPARRLESITQCRCPALRKQDSRYEISDSFIPSTFMVCGLQSSPCGFLSSCLQLFIVVLMQRRGIQHLVVKILYTCQHCLRYSLAKRDTSFVIDKTFIARSMERDPVPQEGAIKVCCISCFSVKPSPARVCTCPLHFSNSS